MCLPFAIKLPLVVLIVLRASDVFITADAQNGRVAECKTDQTSSWHQYWKYPVPNGTKCDINCPLDCSCNLGNYSEVIVNCLNSHMSVSHVSYPSNMTILSWAHNGIENISQDSFMGLFKTLEALHLNRNSLQNLQPYVFERLIKLQVLDLRHNMLEEIRCGVFGGLESLKGLDLSYNVLHEIRPCIFTGVEGLLWLHYDSNILKEIQPGVFNGLGHLTHLNLHNNLIEELQPSAFDGLGNLLHLFLYSNILKEIQPSVFNVLENLTHLNLRSNLLEKLQPSAFDRLGNLLHLSLHSNVLKEIHPSVFNGLRNLLSLSLHSNLLKEIKPSVFDGLGNLMHLSLYSNLLEEMQPGVLNGLGNLTTLSLYSNMLKKIQPGVINGLQNLLRFSLSSNLLEEIQPGVFSGMGKLERLFLSRNMLTKLLPTVLRQLTSLVVLHLSDNPIGHLHPGTFKNLTSLNYLALHNISLTFLPENIFQALLRLKHLDLSANNLQKLRFHPFEGCSILETLNLTNNPLQWISKDSFIGLNVSAKVFVDIPASCCFVERANCIPNLAKSPFLTCSRLLPYDVLRITIWIVSILSIVNNLLCIVVKCKQKQQVNRVQFLLITNLSISDLLMGVYLIVLLSADLYYTDYFPSHSEAWRTSNMCKVAGSFSVLSSEASVFFITLISIDRFLRVKFPFGKYWLSNKSAKIVLIVLWLAAFGISITSFVLSGMDPDLYAVPEICVGLPLSRHHTYSLSNTSVQLTESLTDKVLGQEYKITGSQVAWYFSIAIFTVLNLACFLIVGFCYAAILILTCLSSKKSGLSMSRSEIGMAKKMFLLVFTDFCCWVPIGLLSILVQAGAVEINPVAYAWIATFLLPINSCINPFLYTLGDVIADKVSCSCMKCKQESSDEHEMRPIPRSK